MSLFGDTYRGRRVLLTGHTGFKGSWLALWLTRLGADVCGVSIDPQTSPNHWDLLKLDIADHRIDLRDRESLSGAFASFRPEIVFHLAAQPLVRRSYRDPLETWSTNVMGTANLLDVCRQHGGPALKAIVVITTDKCYENREWPWGYREIDRLGGHDPYSASKAATELVAASYRKSFFALGGSPLLATARAGNVIGGGDWSEDRLIPDLVRSLVNGSAVEIRAPGATRPWQHVLESLSGYLMLGQRLFEGRSEFADAWNFGPEFRDNRPVGEILQRLRTHWPGLSWHVTTESQPHEATLLYLDSSKARAKLQWRPVWGLEEALVATANWYRDHSSSGRVSSLEQLDAYIEAGHRAGVSWGAA